MLNILQARTKMNQVTIILHVLLSSLFDFDITPKQDKAKILEFPSEKKTEEITKAPEELLYHTHLFSKGSKGSVQTKTGKNIAQCKRKKTLRDFKECLKCLFNNSQK